MRESNFSLVPRPCESEFGSPGAVMFHLLQEGYVATPPLYPSLQWACSGLTRLAALINPSVEVTSDTNRPYKLIEQRPISADYLKRLCIYLIYR